MEKINGDTELLEVNDSEEEAVVLDSDDDVASFGNGYIRRGVSAVCTPTLCCNDFVAVKASGKFSSLAYGPKRSDLFSQTHLDIKDDFSSERDVVEAFPSEDGMEYYGQKNILDIKTKKIQVFCKVSTRSLIDEDNLSGNNCKGSDNEKLHSNADHLAVKVKDSESQESEDLSQANALGFVDRYISMNNMHFLEKDTPGKISKLKSPLVSGAKGSQSLARRAIIGTSCGLSRTFEWDDDIDNIEEHVLQSKDMNAKLDGSKIRSVKHSCNQKLLRAKKCREFSNSLVENHKAIDEVDQVSKMNLDKELNEKGSLQIEAGDIGENVPDAYDVGFDTQMAAEAMEALFYAPPSKFNDDHAYQDPGNITGNSSVAKKTHFNNKIKSKQKHGSSEKLNDKGSKFMKMNKMELDLELPESKMGESRKRLKSLTKTDTNSVRNVNVSVRSCNSSVNVTEQGKKAKALDRGNVKEVDEDIVSLISGEYSSRGQVPLQRKRRSFSSIVHSTRHSSKGQSMDETKDQPDSSAQGMKGDKELVVLKRRQNNENAEMLQFSTVERKRSKTCFLSSGETGNVKASEKQPKHVNLELVGWNSKLEVWGFTKGKRKHRKARHQLKGLSFSPTPGLVEKTGPSSFINNPKRSEENSNSSCLKVYVRRRKRSIVQDHQVQSTVKLDCEDLLRPDSRSSCLKVYVRSKSRPLVHNQVQSMVVLNFEDSLRQNSEVQSSTNEELNAPSEDNFETSRFCGSKGNAGPIPPKCANKLLDKPHNAKASLSGSENLQVCDRKCSSVPLVKELFSLGISEPGLTSESKPSRRRREMRNIRVLFSQNMDDTIIKKQKKILERLGSFVASSCSEATHFVADRFVRTKNMLEAIALGKPVVTHMWIVSCGQANFFVDEKNYVLRDAKKEREIGFSLPVSLASSRKAPLLKGRRVIVTPNINPGKELIVSLVKAVNGEVLSEAEDRFHEAVRNEMLSDLLILSCEQDYALCAPFLEQGAAIYSSELLLNGIVIQRLEFERHRLFINLE